MNKFRNFFQFQQEFADNAKCHEYLKELRWEGKPECPHCGSEHYYAFSDGHTYKCKACQKKYNVLIGSIFENTKIPLNKWFWAIYVATSHKKGISSCQLARDIKVQQRTAWFMLHRLRESFREENGMFSSKIVEVDETYLGGKEKNKHLNKKVEKQQGRPTTTKGKTPVLGIIERGGQVYAESLTKKKDTLIPKIREKVETGTTVITDEFSGYKDLKYYYTHKSINHSQKIYVDGEVHTNTIEGFFSHIKRSVIGVYHFVTPRHLNRYCGEWAFRYNTRKFNDTDRFEASIKKTVGKRLTYKWLTAKHNWT